MSMAPCPQPTATRSGMTNFYNLRRLFIGAACKESCLRWPPGWRYMPAWSWESKKAVRKMSRSSSFPGRDGHRCTFLCGVTTARACVKADFND
jgi:hypothetical protein